MFMSLRELKRLAGRNANLLLDPRQRVGTKRFNS
jgi:hypothetical protein